MRVPPLAFVIHRAFASLDWDHKEQSEKKIN